LCETDEVEATGRFIKAGQLGSDATQDSVLYFFSANYETKPTSAVGDVFAAVMGYKLGVGLNLYPYAAVAHVQGAYDLNTYTTSAGKDVTTLQADASAAVVAWAFIAIGEMCNVNGLPGYQPAAGDYIINYFLAPLGFPYKSVGGTETVGTSTSYYGQVSSSLDNFITKCRVFDKDTTYAGHPVSSFDFECDVTVDYTGLWDTNATRINGCLDSNRYIGVMVDVVGAGFDVDVSVADLNAAVANSQKGNKLQFNSGTLEFSWANFMKVSATKTSVGSAAGVVATYLVDDSAAVTLKGAVVAKQIIYVFDSPKSSGLNVFFWDPTVTVLNGLNAPTSSSSVVALFGLLFLSLFSNFF
jgi:hypothetical protein